MEQEGKNARRDRADVRRYQAKKKQAQATMAADEEKRGSVDKGSDSAEARKDEHMVSVRTEEVDTGAALVAGKTDELDATEAARILRKIDWHILPLMCILYWIQFMDKTTLGSAAILGIEQAAHLSTNQYNWLGTIFYLSYLLFEFPQNLALQRFPVAKWMSINIFVWAVALCSHAACTSFGGLFAVRFILGMCEGSITAGFMIVSAMFYTRKEQTLRVGYWFLMNGTAQIVTGFIAFGSLHIHTTKFEPWQWLMIITGTLTFIISLLFWFFFPDTPTTAWFLTPQERAIAVLRIKVNQTGVENKHFKKEQMIEALLDPKTWLFALFSALDNVPNSLTNQYSLIIASFGFTTLQTTLLSCVSGLVEILTIATGVHISARLDSRAMVAVAYFLPNILGTILINVLPWSDRVGLLFSIWLTGVGTTAFVLSLSWLSSVTAGHTKRVTTNAIMLGAYCIGNAAGPFMWEQKYKPRNHVPWTIIGVCYGIGILIILAIRQLLITENKHRNTAPASDDPYDDVYVERIGEDGKGEMVKVAKEYLDLTDRQNRDFRYVY
uniref:MFS general substrate transporter n=1 Tax=Mycena chlorophos TaxID=658473 RepID=A0ABQ0LZ59_MYCCL|nr:MFS general substrate transporter [Mycena chlorophos]